MARGAQVDARNKVSLNPRTQGEKAQGTWQLGPARGFVCLQKLLACFKKRKKEEKTSLLTQKTAWFRD
jgi:hypothetical protein